MWQQLRSKQFSKKTIPWMFVFAAILAYGLLTPWMGFYWDDWVFVWLLKHHGPIELARSFLPYDPLVSPFFLITSSIFGTNPFAWQIFGLVVRIAVSLAAWWTFIWALTGDPLGWFQGSAKWTHELGLPAINDAIVGLQSPGLLDSVFIFTMLGAAILLDYLADGATARRVAGVFLIATPFIGDGGWPVEELRPTRQVAIELHPGAPLHLYQGRDDETVPSSHIELFAAAFPDATIRRLEGRDHQLNDDLSEVARDIRLLG